MIAIKERQRFAALDDAGLESSLWQVIHVRRDGRRRRAVLFDVAEPGRTMQVDAAALADASRFRLVSDAPAAPRAA